MRGKETANTEVSAAVKGTSVKKRREETANMEVSTAVKGTSVKRRREELLPVGNCGQRVEYFQTIGEETLEQHFTPSCITTPKLMF